MRLLQPKELQDGGECDEPLLLGGSSPAKLKTGFHSWWPLSLWEDAGGPFHLWEDAGSPGREAADELMLYLALILPRPVAGMTNA